MTTPETPSATEPAVPSAGSAVLASDPEREHVAARLREAAAEGRLAMSEADERQAAAYAARTRADLVPLVADLPRPHRHRPRRGPLTPAARRRVLVHAGVIASLFSLMFVGWLLMDPMPGPGPGRGPFFPLFPVFLMLLTLFVHLRRADREPSPDETVPEELR
ncbi:DUF1707 domain-containing protein [Pseudonocardia phyllosphaerae]|uniref:DUF1707 domain-containing protein n=1 Tax=Pseudonocardia phyllosphaerae TaxID=3390502 RepID=UPI00397C2724